VVAAVIAAALGLAACSEPPTVGDGTLGVDWAVLPTPSVSAPAAGACTAAEGAQTAGWALAFLPGTAVDCAQPHLTETVDVGVFPSDVDTDPNTVPALGGARFRYAYTTCVERATAFLGGDLHTSRLAVLPVMPSERQWAGRARWFRCELMELAGLDRTIVPRTGTLRDALAGAGRLGPTCADITLSEDQTEVLGAAFTPCEGEHDVELTGAFSLPDGEYPTVESLVELTTDGCLEVGAAYVGIDGDELLRAGSTAFEFAAPITAEMWSAGERSTSCFYGSLSQRRSGSVRDLGAFPY
jgi:Septum formation